MPRTNKHVYGERAFWVKGEEAEMAKGRRLSVILRMGDRSDVVKAPQQWLPLLESVPIYSIRVPGDQAKGIAAVFEPDEGLTVKIVRRTVTRLCDVKDADLKFNNGTAVPRTTLDMSWYLRKLVPGKTFTSDDLITVYWVVYLEDVEPATD